MVSEAPRRASRFVRWAARVLRTQERNIVVWERLILTSFLVTLVVYAMRNGHVTDSLEARWLDLMAVADRPSFKAPIAVVAITDADYYDPSLFGGTSPLNPGALARVLRRVLEHNPSGLILDVQIHPAVGETEERTRARLRLYRMLDSTSTGGGPPIVLVRDLQAEVVEQIPNDSMRVAWKKLISNRRLFWASPSIERSGGYVRSLPRYITGDEAQAPTLPTILGAAITAFGLVPHRSVPWWTIDETHPTSQWRIRFTGLFLEDTPAVTPHRTNARALLSSPHIEGQRSLLTDRIVLVGGTYYAGRDRQPTAVGDMAGVYVWAEAIASWIRHDALREPLGPITFALEFLIGVVAGLLLVRLGPAFGLLGSLLIVGPLTVVFSLLTFGDRVLFVNFLPSFMGVYLHYQAELHWEIRQLKRQLRLVAGSRPLNGPSSEPAPSSSIETASAASALVVATTAAPAAELTGPDADDRTTLSNAPRP